jgi:hypothetical protein
VVFPFGYGDQQEDPFTAFLITLYLLDTVIVPLLLRYYKWCCLHVIFLHLHAYNININIYLLISVHI